MAGRKKTGKRIRGNKKNQKKSYQGIKLLRFRWSQAGIGWEMEAVAKTFPEIIF